MRTATATTTIAAATAAVSKLAVCHRLLLVLLCASLGGLESSAALAAHSSLFGDLLPARRAEKGNATAVNKTSSSSSSSNTSTSSRNNTTNSNSSAAAVTTNIVGGTTVTNGGKYPFYAIPAGAGTLCGASLVHGDILVTAAHCAGAFAGRNIYLGTTLLNGSTARDTIRAVSELAHPDFDAATFENDVLLVKLSRSATGITPVPYATSTKVPAAGDVTSAVGFGRTAVNGDLSSTLRDVAVSVVDNAACAAAYGAVNRTVQLCAGQEGKDSCGGDSGGPLLSRSGPTTLVGIVSFGNGCGAAGYPGVYARVGGVDDFIRRGICDLSDDPPSSCTGCGATAKKCKGFFVSSGVEMHVYISGACLNSCVSLFGAYYLNSGWFCGACP